MSFLTEIEKHYVSIDTKHEIKEIKNNSQRSKTAYTNPKLKQIADAHISPTSADINPLVLPAII
mgnify:CR=1 FL=1